MRLLRWVLVAVVVAGSLALLSLGADLPKDPTLRPAEGQVSLNRTPFGDFGEIGFRIEGGAAQATAARCALLAETAAQQQRGLMDRRDIGGYDGMLFEFGSEINGTFWMKDTPLPLSIAFFDASGRFVSTTDMAPCIHQDPCPTYSAARPYRWALEVPQGAIPRLGIGPDTRLVPSGPCL